MKNLLLILFVFSFLTSVSQPVINRTLGTNTVNDPRWMATKNLIIPRYTDTVQANLVGNIGLDTCGAIIFTYADSGRVYVRKCFPIKYWAAIGSGGGGGSGSITGNNAVTASTSTNLQWGGTLIKNTTIDGGIGYEVNFQNIGQYTIYSDAGSTTRLKISSTATNLFAPNGGSGYILQNDSLYEIGTGRSNDTLYKIRTINPITGAEAYSNWTGLGVKANNGTSVSAATVQIGGSDLIQYSAIGLNGFPLTILHNGVNNAAQSDSNSLRLTNNTIPTTFTDSNVTPRLIFSAYGWKTLPGPAAGRRVSFALDALGKIGNPDGNALFRISSNKNNLGYNVLFSMDAGGIIQQNLNLNGSVFGNGTGSGGVAIGAGSPLQLQTVSASRNTAIGSGALAILTDGSDNTAIGPGVLAGNIIGNFNTAVGSLSLNLNTSNLNTAVGYSALKNNTTGSANTAIGVNALTANTTATKNTAIGAGAMENNTTGGFNAVVGEDGLLHNTTGTNNVAMGWLSGALNQIGIGNVSIGFNAGTLVASGDNNTFLGTSAGNVSPQEDTLSESIAIGHNSITTASNQMVLGSTNIHQTKIFGSQVGSVSDSLYSRKSDGTLGSIAQSSIVGATPTWEQTIIQQGATVFTQANTVNFGDFRQTWTANGTWASLNGILLSSSSTDLSGAGQARLLDIRFTGNQTGSTISSPLYVSNTHTTVGGVNIGGYFTVGNSGTQNIGVQTLASGSSSDNIGILAGASGGTTNSAINVISGNVVLGVASSSGTASLLHLNVPTTTATTTSAGILEAMNSLTTGTGHYIASSSLTSGKIIDIAITGTAALTNQTGINISLSGANGTGAQTTYGAQISNTHSGTSVNVGLAITTTGGSSNFPLKLVDGTEGNGKVLTSDANGNASWATASGSVTWNGISNPTGDQALTFDVGESSTWTNSNTTEDLLTINTSTLTTASLFSLNSTSTVLAAGNNLAELIMSGVNGSNAITATALKISVTNTNVTSGTNIGIDVTATGATTNNIALKVTGTTASSTAYSAQFIGRVAMGGVTAPQADLDLGNGIILTGGLSISPAGGGSTGNMLSGTTNILTGNTNAIYQVLSSTTIDGRIFFGGTGATAVGAGRPYGTVIIGGATVPESGSGTHALLSSLIIKAPSITGGVATVTNTSTLYIEGAPSATVSGANYSLWVDDGLVRLDAGILMGAGTATAGTAPIKLTSGTNMTVAEAGAVEYDATELFATNSTAVRGSIIVVRLNSSSAGTLTLATTYTHYVFTGTTTTWTLPAVSGTTNHIFHIKNRGSGAITINTAAAANEIYSTSAVNTYTVNAGEAIVLLSDGTFWNLE